MLTFVIKAGSGLIQQQDTRVFEDSTGDSHTLALPTAQTDTALADDSFIFIWQFHYEVVGISGFGGVFDFGFAWDLDGKFVKVIQKDLRMPAAVHIRGDYAVFPELQGRVTVLDKDGAIVAQVGDNPNPRQRANFGLPQNEWKDGICNSPHGASIDKDGNLIVAEWTQFGHLHKFAKQP